MLFRSYTLCAVSDEVSSSQAPDSSTEIDITPRISGYQGALSVTPKHGSMYDLRFVHAGLSLEAAAEACGVDVRTFRRWEKDNRAPLAVQKLLSFRPGYLARFAIRDWVCLFFGVQQIKKPR